MSQAVKPFPGVHLVERSEMVHGMITGAECKKKKKKENGRSLGRVRSTPFLPESTQAALFFSLSLDYRVVYCALHFTS